MAAHMWWMKEIICHLFVVAAVSSDHKPLGGLLEDKNVRALPLGGLLEDKNVRALPKHLLAQFSMRCLASPAARSYFSAIVRFKHTHKEVLECFLPHILEQHDSGGVEGMAG